MKIVLSKLAQEELKATAVIDPLSARGESEKRMEAIDELTNRLKEEQPKAFLPCPIEKKKMKPDAQQSKCKGEAPNGTQVCDAREVCTRYLRPEGKNQFYSDFWKAGDKCQFFVSIHRKE